jgi:hypothetical protein
MPSWSLDQPEHAGLQAQGAQMQDFLPLGWRDSFVRPLDLDITLTRGRV